MYVARDQSHSQFSKHMLQHLRKSTLELEAKDRLITKVKQENAQTQEAQRYLDEVRESLKSIGRARSQFK